MAIDISLWKPPPASLLIEADDLHLWRFRIDISAQSAANLRQLLAADECARADRFIRPLHQVKYIAARYALRWILAGYLQHPPVSIVFDYSPQGKPALGKSHRSKIRFNLSHSGDWALLAVTTGADLGVDVEEVVLKDNVQQLGDYAFNDVEKRVFANFSPARRQRGFYRLWTAKEARLKMLGVGLGEMNRAVHPRFQCSFVPAKGYTAAVATNKQLTRIVRYHYEITQWYDSSHGIVRRPA